MRIGMVIAAVFVAAAIVGLFNRRASMSRWNVWAVLKDGPCAGRRYRMDEARSVCDVPGDEPGVTHRYVVGEYVRGGRPRAVIHDDYVEIEMRYAVTVPLGPLPVEHRWSCE